MMDDGEDDDRPWLNISQFLPHAGLVSGRCAHTGILDTVSRQICATICPWPTVVQFAIQDIICFAHCD